MSGSVPHSSLISLGLAAILVAAGTGAAMAQDGPARVVSMNLCTDQLAMLLAAPGQLVSVSAIASDPLVSPMAEEAATYPPNHGGAEEVFLLDPDLVVAGEWSDPTVISMLRRLGLRVEQFSVETRLDQIPGQIARMGELLGNERGASALIRRFETEIAALIAPPDGPRAAFYYPNGYTLGTGSLAHDIVETAGFSHIADELARSDSGQLALELLITAAPDLVIGTQVYPGASRSEEILRHPALRALIADSNGYDTGPEWVCGTPAVLTALADLVALREAIAP